MLLTYFVGGHWHGRKCRLPSDAMEWRVPVLVDRSCATHFGASEFVPFEQDDPVCTVHTYRFAALCAEGYNVFVLESKGGAV